MIDEENEGREAINDYLNELILFSILILYLGITVTEIYKRSSSWVGSNSGLLNMNYSKPNMMIYALATAQDARSYCGGRS